MAPSIPEEVDVFTVPHCRMKELVNDYFLMLQSINFSDSMELELFLESLVRTFVEFKVHEQIENKYIMKRLKNKLKQLSIKNTAVCNCHKDNRVSDMMQLLQDGYTKKTDQDRINYGLMLRKALEEFTEDFLPHMKEEEEVFQPLLLKYFSYEEMCRLKNQVIQQHFQCKDIQVDPKTAKEALLEVKKYDTSSSESEDDHCEATSYNWCGTRCREPESYFQQVPPEVTLKILSYLNPQDLCRCAQVCRNWSDLAKDLSLWTEVYPVQWAQGKWDFRQTEDEKEEEEQMEDHCCSEEKPFYMTDEDADIDESDDSEHDEEQSKALQQARNEARILTGMVKYVLPSVGEGVHKLDISHSKGLTNGLLNKMLQLCPNLEYLNLTDTKVADGGFKGLDQRCMQKLTYLNLSGCVSITDATLEHLARVLNSPPKHQAKSRCQDKRQKLLIQPEAAPCGMDPNSCICLQLATELQRTCSLAVSGVVKPADRHNLFHKISRLPLCGKGEEKKDCESSPNSRSRGCSGKQGRMVSLADSEEKDISTEKEGFLQQRERTFDSGHDGNTSKCCHRTCAHSAHKPLQNIEECVIQTLSPGGDLGKRGDPSDFRTKNSGVTPKTLQYLNLSGCFQITDAGLSILAGSGDFPKMKHLDLSGCLNMTSQGLHVLVNVCPGLPPEELFYCDNIVDGPFPEAASGCRNLECTRRVCCRSGH